MKSPAKDGAAINFICVRRDRPVALLLIIFAVSWLYSMFTLYALTGSPDEKRREETIARSAEAECAEKLRSLKSKTAALGLRADAALPRQAGSAVIPFDIAGGDNLKLPLETAPPEVKVRALGERGTVKVALIDIGGEESRLMCEQEVFGESGRVLRIDNEGVTWAWGSEEFRSLIWE